MGRMIDADALIRRFKTASPMAIDGRARQIVEEMPTIEERKTGKWIIEPYDVENDIWVHRCDRCMKVAMLGGKTPRFKYCPNCGTQMKGDQT